MGFLRAITRGFYKNVSKPILFQMDPERVHDRFISLGETLGRYKVARAFLSAVSTECNEVASSPILAQDLFGLHFSNPFGVAGGFDKDARLTDVFPALHFGFMEIGSVTWQPYPGNPLPRLMRFPKTGSIWVNYGLKNQGAEAIYNRLKQKQFTISLWINVAKTNCKETVDRDAAVKDYCESLKIFRDLASVFTVNISCPNAFGGQPFHKAEDLDLLLKGVSTLQLAQPIFLKISPEISDSELDALLAVCDRYKVDGIIISNLRKEKVFEDIDPSERGNVPEHGGFSGAYLKPYADKMLAYVAGKIKRGECKKYILVGLGGVRTAEDAYKKIRLGANLVQLVTGMIFEGPQVIGDLSDGLYSLLKKDGFTRLQDAVGVDVK